MHPSVSKCSNCGAGLGSTKGPDGIRCAYCGTLNRVEPEPPPPAPPPVFRPFVPASRRRSSVAGRLLLRAVILVAILGVAAVQFLGKHKSLAVGESLLPVVNLSNMTWEGVHGAIVTDVNGDHVPDLVGRVRYVIGGDRVTLGAFDGRDGSKIWESDPLGTYTQTYQGALGLADDTLLFASSAGELRAFAVRDGKKLWTSSLPEKPAGFCHGDRAGEVRIRLVDQRFAPVRLSDGQAAAASASAPAPSARAPRGREKEVEPCIRLASDDGSSGDPGTELRTSGHEFSVEGMTIRAVMQHPGGPKVALGTRDRGTSVPMIAAVFEGDASRNWKSDLAGTRPLETGPFASEHGALTASHAFTDYGYSDISKPHTLVSFDLGGHRQWETPLPSRDPIGSIQASEQLVFVSQWGRLTAYDASSGKTLFAIGKR
jgi:outer membrane protein assembly factor BamB